MIGTAYLFGKRPTGGFTPLHGVIYDPETGRVTIWKASDGNRDVLSKDATERVDLDDLQVERLVEVWGKLKAGPPAE